MFFKQKLLLRCKPCSSPHLQPLIVADQATWSAGERLAVSNYFVSTGI